MMMDGLCEHLKYNYLTMKIVNQFLFLIISQFFLIQLANCDGDSIFKNTYFVILSQPNKADLAMAHQTRKLLQNDLGCVSAANHFVLCCDFRVGQF